MNARSETSEPPPSIAERVQAKPAPLKRFGRLLRRLKVLVKLRRLYLLRAELRFVPTEAQRLFALTVIIGGACGLAAVTFHLSIGFLEHHLIDRALAAPGYTWIIGTIATPILGALVCGALLEYVVPNARGSGIPQVKVAFARRDGRVDIRDSFGKFLVGSLQIGSGASLGREGPTVQICAGIASALGRLIGVSARSQRRLLPVGVAAGIAAAFNAPIAAVTFTIEEVVGTLDQTVLSGVIVAAALAAVIERSVLGENPIFAVPQSYGLHHASSLLIYAIIGLAAACASFGFTEGLLGLRGRFRQMRKLPPWMRPAIGGAVTGVLAVAAFWTLGVRGVTGGGYETLGQALTGQLAFRAMILLCAAKLVATSFSYASGGAGGIFAPSLFIGGMLGGALSILDAKLLGHFDEPSGAFALVGMGAVFAGVIRAPITSVLIIVEMTRAYSLILPLMIANMTAYGLARYWRPKSIYEALLDKDGIRLPSRVASDVHDDFNPISLIDAKATVHAFRLGTTAREIAAVTRDRHLQHVYPVLDASGLLLGIITPDELAILRAEPELIRVANAADLMRSPVAVSAADDLSTVLEKMLTHGVREIPVTNAQGVLVGWLDEGTVAKAYSESRRRQVSANRSDFSPVD